MSDMPFIDHLGRARPAILSWDYDERDQSGSVRFVPSWFRTDSPLPIYVHARFTADHTVTPTHDAEGNPCDRVDWEIEIESCLVLIGSGRYLAQFHHDAAQLVIEHYLWRGPTKDLVAWESPIGRSDTLTRVVD